MKFWSSLICIVTLASFSLPASAEFLWQNPGGDPLRISFQEAIRICPKIPDWAKPQILATYPDSFQVVLVRKNESVEDWMMFGTRKVVEKVRNQWDGHLYERDAKGRRTRKSVPEYGRVLERTFRFDLGRSIVSIRIRRWIFCGNISGKMWSEKKAPLKSVRPAKPSPKPVGRIRPVEPTAGARFLTEISHWNNDADPTIRFAEAKAGLRGWWKPFEADLQLETDAWLVLRDHAVQNGTARATQFPLFQLNPRLEARPTHWSFLLLGDALTLSTRGKDSNTVLALGQARIIFVDLGPIEPHLQASGSLTDSWPRYLGSDNRFPESRARYQEVKGRFGLFHLGSVHSGYEGTWFAFAKTRVDELLQETNVLQYESTGRPSPGGVFLTLRLPWRVYVDGSIVREHIDSSVYSEVEGEMRWVPGDNEEWRFNIVISRGFRLGLF